MGIAGFILGLLSLLCCWLGAYPFGWLVVVMGILGIVFSAIGKASGKKRNEKTGLATAGLVLSILGVIFAIMFFMLFGIWVAAALSAATGNITWITKLSYGLATWIIALLHLTH